MTTVLDQILAVEKASEEAVFRAQTQSTQSISEAKSRHSELLEQEKQMLAEARNKALSVEKESLTQEITSIEKDADHTVSNIRSGFAQKRELLVTMVMQALKE